MENRDKIIEILTVVRYTTSDIEKQADRICALFNVVGQSEQLPDTCQDYARGKTGCIMNGHCKECS